jgi:glycogen synthase
VSFRIAFISAEFPPDNGKGGIGTYVNQVAKAMAGYGADVHVFAGSATRQAVEFSDGFTVHWIRFSNLQQFRIDVAEYFSIIHAQQFFSILECAEIGFNALHIKKKFPDVPLVIRAHAPNYLVEHTKKTYYGFATKFRFFAGAIRRLKWDLGYWRKYHYTVDEEYRFMMMADYITCPSLAMKNWLVLNWRIAANKIDVLPNIFVPPAALLQIEAGQSINERVILFYGRLNVLKGLVNATLAMRQILKHNADWQFWLIGDDGAGPLPGTSMKQWIAAQLNQFQNRVRFIPGVLYEDMPAYLSSSSIVLLPSLFESFSYTCAEAMAAAKPVVGSRIGGMADLIADGKSGVLIHPHRVNDIVIALQQLIDSETLQLSMGREARNTIVNCTGAQTVIESFYRYYLQKTKANG